jgi:hypothetical protein
MELVPLQKNTKCMGEEGKGLRCPFHFVLEEGRFEKVSLVSQKQALTQPYRIC